MQKPTAGEPAVGFIASSKQRVAACSGEGAVLSLHSSLMPKFNVLIINNLFLKRTPKVTALRHYRASLHQTDTV